MIHPKKDSKVSGAGAGSLERLEIPIQVVPEYFSPVPNSLEPIVQLQTILQKEEQHAFQDASRSPGLLTHPFTQIYNSAVYQKSMCKLLEHGCDPLLSTLQNMLDTNRATIQLLKERKSTLLAGKHTHSKGKSV